jgi:TolB-like protein/Tfp pilus assembly protein PilF
VSLFSELRRRHVFKVGAAYLVAAWLIAQVLDLVLDAFPSPDWVMQVALILLAVGFAIALLLAWAYEMTPDGIRRETGDESGAGVPPRRSGHLAYILIAGGLVVALALKFSNPDTPDAKPDIAEIVARPSIVILPFDNVSGDASQDFVAFGLTDELINGLQALGSFPVISRDASLSFPAAGTSASAFAEGYGASYFLEGSVNQAAGAIRVLVNMSSTTSGQVWAERFQVAKGSDELFEIVDQLVTKTARAILQSEVTRVRLTRHAPSDAWEYYMKGLSVVLEYDDARYAEARADLDAAVEIAPEMAEAWWAIGELEVQRYLGRPLGKEADLDEIDEIIGYFRKAHELSPFHGAACGCLGYLLTAVGQPEEARVVFEQALEANPLSSDLRIDYAYYLVWAGHYEDAARQAALALELGPVVSDRAAVWGMRSVMELAAGQRQQALDSANKALFLRKDAYNMPVAVAVNFVLGNTAEAAALYRETKALFPGLEPGNPVLHVVLKPIDEILAAKYERGEYSGPVSVEQIFAALADMSKP